MTTIATAGPIFMWSNDFGRKNLYRNNGDGTFTDVAAQAGAEDVGAGMSVSLARLRQRRRGGSLRRAICGPRPVSASRLRKCFKNDSSETCALSIQKHAMGNSLLRNQRRERFDDTTMAAGVGMGRWAWSSDAFDFDHDGFPDLYITNGMVSGLRPMLAEDLNSFFWRQVVANSPDEARASHDYEQGWNAINELIRSDANVERLRTKCLLRQQSRRNFLRCLRRGWSGLRGRWQSICPGRFRSRWPARSVSQESQCSAVAAAEECQCTNLPPSIAFRLRGTKSNRDAIGASVTIETSVGPADAHASGRIRFSFPAQQRYLLRPRETQQDRCARRFAGPAAWCRSFTIFRSITEFGSKKAVGTFAAGSLPELRETQLLFAARPLKSSSRFLTSR